MHPQRIYQSKTCQNSPTRFFISLLKATVTVAHIHSDANSKQIGPPAGIKTCQNFITLIKLESFVCSKFIKCQLLAVSSFRKILGKKCL
jgi:hypothetical protein